MSAVPKLRFPEFDSKLDQMTIGQVGSVSMCKRVMKDQTAADGDIPFFKIGTFGRDPDAFISKDLFDEYRKRYSYPKKGEVLISAAGTIGRLVVFDGNPAYFQDSNIVWISNQESMVINSYLYQFFLTVKWTTEDTTIARLYNDNLRGIPIAVPSLPEQKKIASFLSSVDKKIDLLRQKRTELELYKKGLMQKIFSQEIRFKGDDGSDFPEWEEVALGTHCEVIMGQSPSSEGYNDVFDGLPLIQGNADIKNRVTMPKRYTSICSKEAYAGDIIMCVRAPIGLVSICRENSCLGRGVAALRAKKSVLSDFLFQFLIMFEEKWIKFGQGSTFTAINGTDIKGLNFFYPCLEEQRKIASFLSAIDSKIQKTSAQIEQMETFKKGLLQQMFV